MRRLALAFAVFAAGIAAGVAIRHPGAGLSPRAREAVRIVEAASGGKEVRVACRPDRCGVVVRRPGATRCDGWVVPIRGGTLRRPQRTAFADC